MTVPVSAGLLTDTAAYLAALTTFRKGDPSAIVDRLALATLEAITNGRRLVAELRVVRARWADVVRVAST